MDLRMQAEALLFFRGACIWEVLLIMADSTTPQEIVKMSHLPAKFSMQGAIGMGREGL